ncbi:MULTISPECIES: SAM-dependent methyltransferase [Sphingomonas]|jgi:cyclopropane-fatty-acyl-phospholipid synthase|uniref:Cyclopropane-fatty-acyl-phospholipid synthase n=1 Tax=Sphingomonas hankookensis TaxID=563996 RepID=A0ABR5Y918_9SPHN|nr:MULTISPECIES: cyclopropane-fatty-acyl-phospholipid synthase family protein [Sphingomonas]KZE10956.1 cyclopropane-fatty-acyl-phospholipid synthase [Sphingomonas hankookensis]PZT91911.1 MAG: class I SAM-dependent methyltransferase [Sphingomonas sp.]RSV31533.1 class I SAM-dependent methyltransferase [Sphingomonas sp. ABOLH]WCP71626.1 cyclopropane-fatty-acyl-phospholipid synthase [Sphingomonas hankookensis]
MALIDTFLARTVRRGTLSLTHADGRTVTFGTADPAFPDVAIRFTQPGVAGRIVRHPALGAAEAYMDGELVIDRGDIRDLVELLTSNTPWGRGSGLAPSLPIRLFDAVRHRVDRVNMARRSKRNVAHHYDLSDRLYALFLDTDLQYSCAYFTDPANSLEQAQADKKAHIAAKLALKPGMRVLDIGCGWGGMALYLHEKTGAEVLGVTLSEEQIKVARRRAEEAGVADKVKFELIDYRAVTGRFDRIVSVGMFEHVGPPQYGTFFRKCRELLTDDGVMLLHTIGRMGVPGVTDTFTTKYIFPGGYNPALSEIVRGYEGTKLIATDIEVLRVHYALTIDHWYDRTVAAKDQIVALYDEKFYRMWTFYLAGAAAAFRHGGMVNYQVQLTRNRLSLPLTRDYMLEEERRLRG